MPTETKETHQTRWLFCALFSVALLFCAPGIAACGPLDSAAVSTGPSISEEDVNRILSQLKLDPTRNVLDKVASEVKRIDDLRDAEALRVDQLMKAESRRVDEQAVLRAEFSAHIREVEKQLREAESKRIDAIRAVDVAAVGVASERATQQATVLANQVSASADALRTLVATTATTFQAQQTLSSNQMTERIASLEKASYEGRGKSAVSDPIYSELLIEVKRLREQSSITAGSGTGVHDTWAWVFGGISLLVAIAAVAVSFIKRP